ncbi:MAG: DUF4176 domain-containing protein [Butyrivibrio sp.]|uniref:DUF4176 domain-containing protein n=1 Tax=Butyrivibrio sp. NC2002 TaxID=1410610 RepID=UPI000566AB00|nr:DUF4176 domain-containing protein [Butyrivibrio sp. NC2002]MBE5858637.1 DUF4176 domain-containing protein [Butyrivibrio sp.]
MKKKELLPIGSVVLLKGGNKRLMVCGRIQTKGGDDTVYDYSGCYFPEGMIDSDRMFFFNNENIERIYFIGLQDEEELALTEKILELGEFVVKDGKIVPKDAPSAE